MTQGARTHPRSFHWRIPPQRAQREVLAPSDDARMFVKVAAGESQARRIPGDYSRQRARERARGQLKRVPRLHTHARQRRHERRRWAQKGRNEFGTASARRLRGATFAVAPRGHVDPLSLRALNFSRRYPCPAMHLGNTRTGRPAPCTQNLLLAMPGQGRIERHTQDRRVVQAAKLNSTLSSDIFSHESDCGTEACCGTASR